MNINLEPEAVIYLASAAVKDLRADAEWIRVFDQPTAGPAARRGLVRQATRRARIYRPLLRAAVKRFGAELFRRPFHQTRGGQGS